MTNNFNWFVGVVEDRNDPKKLNRVRVRIIGSHTDDKTKIATPDLPWAHVMMPTTSSSTSGIGLTIHGLVEGSFVVGFFVDGDSKQEPMIMGTFIGDQSVNIKYEYDDRDTPVAGPGGGSSTKPISKAGAAGAPDGNLMGFIDPRKKSASDYKDTPDGPNPKHIQDRAEGLTLDLENSPNHKEYGQETYPREKYLGESDVNKIARPEEEEEEKSLGESVLDAATELIFGEDTSDLGYPHNNIADISNNNIGGYSQGSSIERKPKYPFNHVYESESGHVIEIDDTPDYERINVFHRSGARIEINNKGEIHILAAPGQDFNVQAENINCRSIGKGGKVRIQADTKVDILAKEAAKIVSEGATDIISSGATKITALKDVVMKAVKKVKIQ